MYAIVAVDEKWGIGRDNGLLFRLSADLKRFRSLTEGHTVLMGRKTLQSLPGGKGLPRRRNVVLTGDKDFQAENAEIVHSAAEAVWVAGEDAWVIGGESVYRLFLPLCERVYITRIFAQKEADAFFPDLDADPRWQVAQESEIFKENGLRYQFVDYVPCEEEYALADLLPDRSEPLPFAPPPDFTEFSGIL